MTNLSQDASRTRLIFWLIVELLPGGALLLAAGFTLAIAVACSSGRPEQKVAIAPQDWPLDRRLAVVSSEFGARRGRSRHQGIDVSVPKGTPVWATADGVVSSAGRWGDFGRVVVIDHGDGWQTLFAHLKKIKVREGNRVKRGDVVGTVGKSGNATGYHLHYEVRRNGASVDPRPFL
ncbi:MAG: M23 family metallopeptidase [bacterium]|nr:M23 family metallopeptidase [bacterium]